ncbi:MAG: PorT family protein [Bacteroidaceae bacterium]|nr:PorT family protein [Bacteroidaceae bacterium]
MRKVLFIASLMLLSVVAYAQPEVGTLSIQPKVGLNIAYFEESKVSGVDTKPRLGLVGGLELEYQLLKKLSLSAGALYSMQGEKAKYAGDRYNPAQEETAELDYVNFPVLVNCYILKGLALKVGVQPAVNVRSSMSNYVLTNVNKFDFSIPFGLSYEFKSFVIEARYNLGVTNIIKDDETRNRVVQITAGIKLGR